MGAVRPGKSGLWITFGLLLAMSMPAVAQRNQPQPRGAGDPIEPESSKQYERWQYFYERRAYPNPSVPPGSNQQQWQQHDEKVRQERALRRAAGVDEQAYANANSWTEIGPKPTVARESTTTGEVSGRVTAVSIDPTNANTAFIGTADGGVWKTIDGGANWVPLTDNQVSLAIGALAIAPSSPQTIYAGTGENAYAYDAYYGAGILKSIDGGSTWTQMGASIFYGPWNSTTGGGRIFAIAVNPSNANLLLVGARVLGQNGLWRSTDGGSTWTFMSNGGVFTGGYSNTLPNDIYWVNNTTAIMAFGMSDASTYAPQYGIWKSTDSGVTWSRIFDPATAVGYASLGRMGFAIAPSDPNTMYVGFEDAAASKTYAIWKTTNGGANWAAVTYKDYCMSQCWYDNVVAVHPTNPNVVYIGGSYVTTDSYYGAVYMSADGGNTWNSIQSGATYPSPSLHPDIHALKFGPDGRFWVGNDGGIWSTTSYENIGGTPTTTPVWNNLNHTINTLQFYPGISIDPTNVNVTYGGAQDNGVNKYTGTTSWNGTFRYCGDGGYTAVNATTPSTVFVQCTSLSPIRSLDGGSTYTILSGSYKSDGALFIAPMLMDPVTSTTLYLGSYRLWRSTDNGTNFSDVSGTLDGSTSSRVGAIAVGTNNNKVVYVGFTNGHLYRTDDITAVPPVWAPHYTNLPARWINDIQVDPTNSSVVYVAAAGFTVSPDALGHVFKSTDAGNTWQDISGDLPNTPANAIVLYKGATSDTLFVGADTGVYKSVNGGTNWTTAGAGLPHAAVTSLKLHKNTNTLRASTHGRGMWDLLVSSGTTYTLTVARAGTGSGTVTSQDASINCGSACSNSYNPGAAVTLTAQPALGSAFTGWSGACSGTGSCVLTMNSTLAVTATFSGGSPRHRSGPNPPNRNPGAGPAPVNLAPSQPANSGASPAPVVIAVPQPALNYVLTLPTTDESDKPADADAATTGDSKSQPNGDDKKKTGEPSQTQPQTSSADPK